MKDIQISNDVALDPTAEAKARRFGFGRNWNAFLSVLNEERIRRAEESLRQMLGVENLKGRIFLDIGSGSGLFSLAAIRLGAQVQAFDYDEFSVGCGLQLRRAYGIDEARWHVEQASVLDLDYLDRLGTFDVVYSWGVLHHTGAMWQALANASGRVKNDGELFIAIYNDQGWISRYWLAVKRIYNTNFLGKGLMTLVHFPYLFLARYLVRTFTGRLGVERGMSLWYDMHDWLGGLPFEVASPDAVVSFYRARGLELVNHRYCGQRHGCNEFVFRRVTG